MTRFWLGCAAVNGFLAVAAGAFGAHALKARLPAEMLAVFETSARYQMFHALALFGVALLAISGRPADAAGWSFLVGIVLFCGSLYALALSGIRPLGAITPFGGLAFLCGWFLLLLRAIRL